MAFAINHVGFNTIADIIGFPNAFVTKGSKGLCGGANSERDGMGGIYEYDPAATDTPDQFYIVQQTAITGSNPGRWFRLTEFDPVTNIVPTGSMNMWGAAAAPSGWLLCDGAAINRTTYAALFAIIGTNYGMGDGSTTFNVPDFRQRFPLGKASSGTGATLGSSGGNIDHTHGSPLTTGTPSGTSGQLVGIINVASATHTHSVTVPGDNPSYVTVNYIIKT